MFEGGMAGWQDGKMDHEWGMGDGEEERHDGENAVHLGERVWIESSW